jgi:hypothetical protein
MRIMLSIISLCFALTPLALFAGNDHGIVITLSQTICKPGDVIELRAQMTRSDYAEFELKLPKIDALHFVTQQQSPIQYSKGLYRQSSVWIFQPIQSGLIEWQGIRALIKQGEHETEYELPSMKLMVSPYTSSDDSFRPEPLPATITNQSPQTRPLWLYLLFGLGAIAILYLALRPRTQSVCKTTKQSTSLSDLQQAIAAGDLPIDLIEQILVDDRVKISQELRIAMEAAVYNPHADPEVFRAALDKEVQP